MASLRFRAGRRGWRGVKSIFNQQSEIGMRIEEGLPFLHAFRTTPFLVKISFVPKVVRFRYFAREHLE